MERVVRAMVSLLCTCADCLSVVRFNLTCEAEAPSQARRLGHQSLLPGCVVLTVGFKETVHFTGFWEPTSGATT